MPITTRSASWRVPSAIATAVDPAAFALAAPRSARRAPARRRARDAGRRRRSRSPAPPPGPSAGRRPPARSRACPACRTAAATSSPMKPPPMTTTLRARSIRRARSSALLERAQIDHAVELGAGHRQRPHPRAGRQHQRVVGIALAARRRDRTAAAVDRRHRRRRAAARSPGRRRSGLAEQQPLPLHLAQQQALGQRRPLVGRMGLGADQPDRRRRGRRRAGTPQPGSRPARRRRSPRPPSWRTPSRDDDQVAHGLALRTLTCGDPSRCAAEASPAALARGASDRSSSSLRPRTRSTGSRRPRTGSSPSSSKRKPRTGAGHDGVAGDDGHGPSAADAARGILQPLRHVDRVAAQGHAQPPGGTQRRGDQRAGMHADPQARCGGWPRRGRSRVVGLDRRPDRDGRAQGGGAGRLGIGMRPRPRSARRP